MVLDNLGESLRSTLGELQGKRNVTEDDIENIIQSIQRSLLAADVKVGIVESLSESIKTRALEEERPPETTARDHVLHIVYEELVDIVGEGGTIEPESQTILLAGLQGAGKTTTAGKLGWWFCTQGLHTAVIQTDTFRPGAYSQLEQLAEKSDVEFYGEQSCDDPVEIAQRGLQATSDADVQIVDTAGRHALEDDLISEIEDINEVVEPDHSLLVLDAAIGKSAEKQASQFEESIGIDGVAITKLDGTAKGGGALTAVEETGAGIEFLGTGEEIRDIEQFDPSGFVSRLLGMGDLDQLANRVEQARKETTGRSDKDPEELLDGDFTLYDMRDQLETMQKMGSISQIFDMIPGIGGGLMDQLPDEALDETEQQLETFEVLMDSMTDRELRNPEIIGKERKLRIALGAGKTSSDVEQLLQQYRMMKQTFNQVGNLTQQGDGDLLDDLGGGGNGGLGGFGPF